MAGKKKQSIALTPGEMELINLLWQNGEMSLSTAHGRFGKVGYTTMQTRLNRMVDKGLVQRSATRPALYSAAIAPEDVSSNHLNVLLNRVTEGSIVPLVAQLVNDRSLSTGEIEEIKQLIELAEQRVAEEATEKGEIE